MSSMLEEAKKYMSFFYQNEDWVENPVLLYHGKEVDSEVVDYIKEFFVLLMESKLLSDYTKLYLSSPSSSIRRMVSLYNERMVELNWIDYGTVTSSIKYDRNKLAKYFPSNSLINFMREKEKYWGQMRETLDQLELKYYKDLEYKEKLKIRIPTTGLKRELSEEEWNTLLRLLKTYSVNMMSRIEQGEIERYNPLFMYYHYLIREKGLTKADQARLKELRKVLGFEEV